MFAGEVRGYCLADWASGKRYWYYISNKNWNQFKSIFYLIVFKLESSYQYQGNQYYAQLTFTCSNSTIETLEKGVQYVQSYQ